MWFAIHHSQVSFLSHAWIFHFFFILHAVCFRVCSTNNNDADENKAQMKCQNMQTEKKKPHTHTHWIYINRYLAVEVLSFFRLLNLKGKENNTEAGYWFVRCFFFLVTCTKNFCCECGTWRRREQCCCYFWHQLKCYYYRRLFIRCVACYRSHFCRITL